MVYGTNRERRTIVAERAIEESQRYEAEIRSKLLAANKHLGKRIRALGLEIDYVADQDKLYVTLGDPRPSEALSLGDGTHAVMLLDPETHEVTGLEAPFFMEDFEKSKHESGFWRVVVDLIQSRGHFIYIPPEKDIRNTEAALAALLPSS
jgi:hypothetical protein